MSKTADDEPARRPRNDPASADNPAETADGFEEALAALADDFAARLRRGERMTVEAYAANHPDLAERIRKVFPAIAAIEGPDSFDHTTAAAGERPGSRIGRYKLLERIGEGGFGVVYMAEQHDPVRRKVALKLVKPGMDSRQVLARFEAERQALAIMDHPNIARVFDGGMTEAGRPYFVMELVKGEPITSYCDNSQLPPRQRLELFAQVCHAVQHAHQKGIIHRDIKPSNVLVMVHDATPVVKVIDFGVAKALGQELTEKTLFTGFAQLLGTPLYMSPEQAGQSSLDVDTRSDIYSLGVLLYELLTGTTPFDKERFRKAAQDEIRRIIREEEPPRPSTRLSESKEKLPSISAQRHTEPARLAKLVRGELDWIVMKALEKDRNRRYETASGLAKDVERYLNDEPVSACPPSAAYRLKKLARRNKGPMLAASLVVLALLAGIVGTAWQAVRAGKRAQGERQAKERAEANLDLAKGAVEKYLAELAYDPDLMRADFNPLRKRLFAAAVPFLQRMAEQHGDDPDVEARRGWAYLRLASLRGDLGESEAVLQDAEAARAIFARLTMSFPAVQGHRVALAETHKVLGLELIRLDRRQEAEAAWRQALATLEKLAADFPNEPEHRHELGGNLKDLATLLKRRGARGEAQATLRRAMDILQKLADEVPTEPEYRRSLAQGYNNLGALLDDEPEERDEADGAYRRAGDIHQKLVDEFPTERRYRRDLGKHYTNLGLLHDARARHEAAESAHLRALEIYEALAGEFPSLPEYREESASVHRNLGYSLIKLGEHEKGERAYRQAATVLLKLAADFPAVPIYREQLVGIHLNLGLLYEELAQHDKAEAAYRRAVDLSAKLAEEFPGEPRHRQSLARCHNYLGNVLRVRGQPEKAEAALRDALNILEKVAGGAAPDYRSLVANTYNDFGSLLVLRDRGKADAAYRKALAIREKLVSDFPTELEYATDLGGSYCNIGNVIYESGQPAEAVGWFEKAVARLEPVVARLPRSGKPRQFLCNSYFGRATALAVLGGHAEALSDWERALELDDGSRGLIIRSNLAGARLRHFRQEKDAAGCLAAAAEFDALQRTDAAAQYIAAVNRAICAAVIPQDPKTPAGDVDRLAREQADLAMGWLGKAVAAGNMDAEYMKQDKDLDALRQREDFKKLLAGLE